MSIFKTWRRFLTGWRFWFFGVVLYIGVFTVVRMSVEPPLSVGMAGERQISENVQFFHDDSWIDDQGQRQLSQKIFDGLISSIRDAKKFILLDMFLFNAWQGPTPELHRSLSAEITHALIAQKKAYPDLFILVISDPINTVYGGLPSSHFESMKSAGIPVVLTDLVKLQDSNPFWSSVWRWLIRPFGNSEGTILPNPFGEGRVSIRSYLTLLNFKANHRKLLVTDVDGAELHGWVSSANPHDGSSAHRNVAVRFDGEAVLDLIAGERALLAMNGATGELAALDAALSILLSGNAEAGLHASSVEPVASESGNGAESLFVRVISESVIHDTILTGIEEAEARDTIDIAMFYLSERRIITALKQASLRGVQVRLLLDVNNDAFGRKKNGVPNRPVAAELHKAGVSVRWCSTQGEQCHAKWLHIAKQETHLFVLGSANFTRRNLLDLNLETNVSISAAAKHPIVDQMNDFFEQQWNNRDGKTYSTTYEEFADDSAWLTIQYRFMEHTGLSTF